MKLLHACGELLVLRRVHGSTYGSGSSSQPGEHSRKFHDLSSLHPSWEPKRWSKFYSFVTTRGNKEILVCWVRSRCLSFSLHRQINVNSLFCFVSLWFVSSKWFSSCLFGWLFEQERLILQGLQYDQCCYQITPASVRHHVNDFMLLGDQWNLSDDQVINALSTTLAIIGKFWVTSLFTCQLRQLVPCILVWKNRELFCWVCACDM